MVVLSLRNSFSVACHFFHNTHVLEKFSLIVCCLLGLCGVLDLITHNLVDSSNEKATLENMSISCAKLLYFKGTMSHLQAKKLKKLNSNYI